MTRRRTFLRIALWCGLIFSLIQWPTSYWLTPLIECDSTKHSLFITSRDGGLIFQARAWPVEVSSGLHAHLFLENNHAPLGLATLFPFVSVFYGPPAGWLLLPWWMLASFFALPLVWMWRRDKRTAHAATRAFPVEPAATETHRTPDS
jgi:hypothetical protein